MSDKLIKKLISKYRDMRELHQKYNKKIHGLIVEILEDHTESIQHISRRSKTPESFKEKLERLPHLQLKKLEQIDDLSGIRIILYFDGDVNRIAEIIKENFRVVKDNLRYSSEGYTARHLVVKLDSERLKLPEYKKYKGLLTEIQLTTVIEHGWSQVSHDILYKGIEQVKTYMPQVYDFLNDRMQSINKNHIKKAIYELESVRAEWERAKLGIEIYKKNQLEGLEFEKDNNVIDNKLVFFKEQIERYGLDKEKYPDLIADLKKIIARAEKNTVKPKKLSNYNLPGASPKSIKRQVLNILRQRSVQVQYVTDALDLLELLSEDFVPEISNTALDICKDMAKYNLSLLKTYGYHLQLAILEHLENKDGLKNIEFVGSLLNSLGNPEFSGTEMSNYQTITFKSGSLNHSKQLGNIRGRSIRLIENLYKKATGTKSKLKLLGVLDIYTTLPTRSGYSEDFKNLITENTKQIVSFLEFAVNTKELLILDRLNEMSVDIERHFGEHLTLNLKNSLAEDTEFQIFKAFYGYDIDLYREQKRSEVKDRRDSSMQNLLKDLDEESQEDWTSRLSKYAKIALKTEDISKFSNIYSFVEELAKEQPDYALYLVKEKERALLPFLPSLMFGISISNEKEVDSLVEKYLEKKKNLREIAQYLFRVEKITAVRLKQFLNTAIVTNDKQAVASVVYLMAEKYSGKKYQRHLFLRAVKYLNKEKDYEWSSRMFLRKKNILQDLTSKEYETVLDTLLHVNNIDHHVEDILEPVLVKEPLRVIRLFKRRISEYKKIKGEKIWETRYDAVPYNLRDIADHLRTNADSVVGELLLWYKDRDYITSYEASKLIMEVVDARDKLLDKKIRELIDSEIEENIDIVLNIFEAYRGSTNIHDLVKHFITKLSKHEKYKEYKGHLFGILTLPDAVLTGEYGMVEHLKAIQKSINKWDVKDASNVVRYFSRDLSRSLTERIEMETRNTDKDIALRKAEFGEL